MSKSFIESHRWDKTAYNKPISQERCIRFLHWQAGSSETNDSFAHKSLQESLIILLTLRECVAFYNTKMCDGEEAGKESIWKEDICGICVSHYL